MKFLENLSEFTGGARGGLGALGEVLAAAAMGEASARPGDRAGAGAARGFAMGVGGLGDAFARGRSMRDRDRVRVMAAEKLKDPNLGAAERDLWTAVASGNTAALELFDESLAARGSDRADRAEGARAAYYEQKLAGLGAPKAPTAEQMTQHREIMALRRQFIERPEALADIDLSNPDNDLVRSRQISPVGEDPLGELYLEWSGLDPLMTDRPRFDQFVGDRYGSEGLDLLRNGYGIRQGGTPETGGAVAEIADSPQGGSADRIIDSISGVIGGPSNAPSFFDTEYGGLFNDLFGTNFTGRREARSEMGSLLEELDTAARGPRIVGGGVLVPDQDVDRAFNAITGGGAGGAGRPAGPDLLRREDELRRTTGPASRLDSFLNSAFPAFGAPGFYRDPGIEDPFTRTLRTTGRDVGAGLAQVPGAFAAAGRGLGSEMISLPGHLTTALGSARGGDYDAEVDGYGAGRKAREDFLRALGWGG
jgi:hypothetical protein